MLVLKQRGQKTMYIFFFYHSAVQVAISQCTQHNYTKGTRLFAPTSYTSLNPIGSRSNSDSSRTVSSPSSAQELGMNSATLAETNVPSPTLGTLHERQLLSSDVLLLALCLGSTWRLACASSQGGQAVLLGILPFISLLRACSPA